MRNFIAFLMFMLCVSITAEAQKYTDQVQKRVKGQGTVTINQSEAITDLVNGSGPVKQDDTIKTTPANKKTVPAVDPNAAQGTPNKTNTESNKKQDTDSTKKVDVSGKNIPARQPVTSETKEGGETETPIVDTRKKVMLGGYKVNGFRVQAFAGGNTRNDKIQAQEIGNKIKMAFPDQPVYVHFYSPRWICRVGNYKSMEEANIMLHKIKALGYKQAIIVKGKITVQY